MSVRTTEEAVAEILGSDLDSSANLEPFIQVAAQIVDDNLTSLGYGDTKLELIERWLAAHFYLVDSSENRDNLSVASQSVDGASETYHTPQSRSGSTNFGTTRYGRTAMLLDNKGRLSALEKKIESGRIKVIATHLGTCAPVDPLYRRYPCP